MQQIRVQGSSAFSTIKLADGQNSVVPTSIQILRLGNFNHPKYGQFEITKLVLAQMKTNFELNVRGIDMAFDYFHDSDKEASGWVKALELRENGEELWALVDWTPTAMKKLAERELRYFSPDFAFQWTDPERGVTFDNVLFGGGLTNRPFVKEMKAIVAAENKGVNMTELEKLQKERDELKAANIKLADQYAEAQKQMAAMPPPPKPGAAGPAAAAGGAAEESSEVQALKKQIADLQNQLSKAQADQEVVAAEKKAAEAAKMCAEKELEFSKMLSEGKAVAAQKKAFVDGDMAAFVKLAQPINLKGAGSSEGGNAGSDSEDAKVKSIITLAEEKRKANPKLSQGDAISIAKKEVEAKAKK